ncbi:MAG: hypothetical protein WCP57_12005 [Bacteroidota bacterium]
MFTEKQYFYKNKIVWILLLLFILILFTTGLNTGFKVVNLTPSIVFFILILFFSFMNLQTHIDAVGIHYRYFPFIFKQKTIEWSAIEYISVGEYNPIGDFGGWGIRGWGKRRALNVYGNKGIQIKFKNGDFLLLGTNKMEEAAKIISTYFAK